MKEKAIAERIEHHTNAGCEATAHGKHGRAEYEAARADLIEARIQASPTTSQETE